MFNIKPKEANFAVPLAPAPRRLTRHAIHPLDIGSSKSSTHCATSFNNADSKLPSLSETAALENAIVLHSKTVSFECSDTTPSRRRTFAQSSAPSIAHPNTRDCTLPDQSSGDIPALPSLTPPRVPVFDVRNEWEARVVRTLVAASASCASASCVSLEDGAASRGLLLVRGRYVRQRDVRALLAPHVHPALLDSVLSVLLPLHAPISSLAKLVASGDVSLIGAQEDPIEPLVLLTDLLSALRQIAPQLGLEF